MLAYDPTDSNVYIADNTESTEIGNMVAQKDQFGRTIEEYILNSDNTSKTILSSIT